MIDLNWFVFNINLNNKDNPRIDQIKINNGLIGRIAIIWFGQTKGLKKLS